MHLNNLFNETIRKEGDKYVVRSKKGKSMGKYDSKSAAEKRLRQVEMFKHMAESIKLSEAERDIQVEVPGIGVYTADTLSSNIIQSIDKLHRAAQAGDWEQVEYSLDPSKMGATLLTKAQALVQALKQNRLLEAEPVGTATYTTTGSGIVVPEPKQTKSSTYQNIADMNKIVDANKIKVGQKIKLPDGSSYKVQKGDTLGKITQDFNNRTARAGAGGGAGKAPSGSNLSAWEKTKNLVKDKLTGQSSSTMQALDTASGKTPPPKPIKGARIDTPPVSDTISDVERTAQDKTNAAGEKKPGTIRKVAGGVKNVVGTTVGAGANLAGKTFGAMMYDQAFGTPDTIKNWFADSENQSVRDFGDKYLTSKEGSLWNAVGSEEFGNLALDDQAQVLNHIGMGVAGGMAMIPDKVVKWINKVPGLKEIPFGSKIWNNVMPKMFGLGSALKLRGDWQEAQATGNYGKFNRRLATAVSYGFIKHPAIFFATMALVDPDFDETRAKIGDYIVDKYNSALNVNKGDQQATIGHAAVYESVLFELWANDIASEMLNEKKKITKKNDPCWDGYHMVGTKKKDGREVPNCVPGKKG